MGARNAATTQFESQRRDIYIRLSRYGHVNVKDKPAKIQQPSIMHTIHTDDESDDGSDESGDEESSDDSGGGKGRL